MELTEQERYAHLIHLLNGAIEDIRNGKSGKALGKICAVKGNIAILQVFSDSKHSAKV